MHTLYTRPQTGGFAVHAVLQETGIDHELVTIDKSKGDHRTPHFRSISPLGQVPVLGLPDGSTITESAAMCIYLADLAPGSALSPALNSPLRPHYLRWMIFCSANLYDADLRYYYAGRHTTDETAVEGIKKAALADMDNLFGIADQALAKNRWLLGETFSTADIYIAMLGYWHPDVPGMLATNANLNRLCEAVKQRPAVARAADYHSPWEIIGEDG